MGGAVSLLTLFAFMAWTGEIYLTFCSLLRTNILQHFEYNGVLRCLVSLSHRSKTSLRSILTMPWMHKIVSQFHASHEWMWHGGSICWFIISLGNRFYISGSNPGHYASWESATLYSFSRRVGWAPKSFRTLSRREKRLVPARNRAAFPMLSSHSPVVLITLVTPRLQLFLCNQRVWLSLLSSHACPVSDVRVQSEVSSRKVQYKMCISPTCGMILITHCSVTFPSGMPLSLECH